MVADAFNLFLYQPLYNGLVFFISVVPWGDIGIAVIVLTLLVRAVLFPLSHKSTKSQIKMKEIEPEIKEIKEKHKDKQEQAKKVMELYQKHGLNPFSGCLFILIQMPVIIALYWVFFRGLAAGFDESALYSFITIPESYNFYFLGFIDMLGKSFLLAIAAGISQYFQMSLSVPKLEQDVSRIGKSSLQNDLMKSLNMQMRYGLPVFVFIISYTISAAVALYWLTSNLFSIAHELYVRKKAKTAAIVQK